MKSHFVPLLLAVIAGCPIALFGESRSHRKPDFDEVVVYPTQEDGSLMHWLAISPLLYNVSYLGDSMSADVLRADEQTELDVRPRAGDRVQGQSWHKMHFTGAVQGPTMCELFQVAGRGFDYAITCCFAYVYSPTEHPNAVFAGSSDDALKVVLNGKKIWSNQIQRSPTYDSDQAPAPLRKGWNTLLVVVDQVWGGHLLCARFLDGDQPVKDLDVSLDPPSENAKRHPAGPYNEEASKLIRAADAHRMEGRLAEALTSYEDVLKRFPLSDVAPRAAHARGGVLYGGDPEKSLKQPEKAVQSLQDVLDQFPHDLLAEYALLDLGKVYEAGLKDLAKAQATYESFEELYPQSSLAPKALIEVGRILASRKEFEKSLLTYRRIIQKYAQSDEVLLATLGIARTRRLAGENDLAKKEYESAAALAQDWHDNKYGVDVGKQAWLRSVMEQVRLELREF